MPFELVYNTNKNQDGILVYGYVSSIPSLTETTVVSYTVPSDKTLVITSFIGTGKAPGRYVLYFDLLPQIGKRTSPIERSTSFNFPDQGQIKVSSGSVVYVKVTHEEVTSRDFESTIIGYLV